MKLTSINHLISEKLLEKSGVSKWGYTEDAFAHSYSKFENWSLKVKNRVLKYLVDERMLKRRSLYEVFPEFKSALVFLFSYSEKKNQLNTFYKSEASNQLKIASYAFASDGIDYHIDMKRKLQVLAEEVLTTLSKKANYKLILDTSPVLERDLAYRAGLGWFGRNSMLINRDIGSFTLIGSILFDEKLPLQSSDYYESDHCGSCRACIDACPTDAINYDLRQVTTSQCISTFTIEYFKPEKPIPGHFEKSSGEVFGCDICQDVCPWNRRLFFENSDVNSFEENEIQEEKLLKDFFLKPEIDKVISRVLNMSNNLFRKIFKNTAIERTGRIGVLKNLKVFKVFKLK